VLELYARLKDRFETGAAVSGVSASLHDQREGRLLGARTASVLSRGQPAEERPAASPPGPRPTPGRPAR
jgi:hypothetical protein